MLAITRLTLPQALLPATTALSSLHPQGRILGIAAGANVVMPNLSPQEVRESYHIYDNKRIAGSEAAEGLALLKEELSEAGYAVDLSRGDYQRKIVKVIKG
jgi:biotin synthase